jgi:hypothetical protein
VTASQQPSDALAGKLKRTELQHSPSSIPGREIVQVLTEIQAALTLAGQPLATFVAGLPVSPA